MRTPPRFWHDVDSPKHTLHCSDCAPKGAAFTFAGEPVEVRLLTSDHIFLVRPGGVHEPFTLGYVQCVRCRKRYVPQSVWDPA
jgi:hypothetical protein